MKPIISISGTSRPDNYTSRAPAVVNEGIRESGASVIEFDARQLELNFPGQPMTDDARELREVIEDTDAVVIATPEYHGTFCAMTKLIIENLGFPSALEGKTVSLLGVAAGRIGAIKSLQHLRGAYRLGRRLRTTTWGPIDPLHTGMDQPLKFQIFPAVKRVFAPIW